VEVEVVAFVSPPREARMALRISVYERCNHSELTISSSLREKPSSSAMGGVVVMMSPCGLGDGKVVVQWR